MEKSQGLHAGSRLPGLIACGTQHGRDDFSDRLFVINDENAVHVHREKIT
jgi:hypothetical protein